MSIPFQLKQGLLAAASAATLGVALANPALAIPFRDDVGDEGAQDFAAQWDGVIQIFMWNRTTGAITFNCSGSLINARTVITAAHCLNSRPSESYGTSGQDWTPIIAFGPDTFVPLFNWIGTGEQFVDGRNGLTFGNDVVIHPDGAVDGFGFPAADVAMISLDNPLYTLPTYAMLFSPIPGEVFEQGVHVNQIGYGSFGPGSTGTIGIDGKRRAGENMLGMLGSINDFVQGLAQNESAGFDSPSDNQLLYWIDFDDPNRTGTCARDSAFGFDNSIVCSDWDGFSGTLLDSDTLVLPGTSFDVFPGDALPNEVGTAGGDSGGPLMAMNLGANPLLLGVLSGGFIDGFFHPAGQEFASVSYYNPLFTYYQFIAENNPYKHVSAVAGDGNWSDSSHWVQTLDPNYVVYNEDGELVNGLPAGEEGGVDQRRPTSGIVFDTPVDEFDQDDEPANPNPPGDPEQNDAARGIAAGTTDFAAGGVAATVPAGAAQSAAGGDMGFAGSTLQTVSGQTQTLTGPGYTGFVPLNTNGSPGTRFANPAQYFEVTLSADGTTTVDMDVWIDKLNLTGSGARLLIDESWGLFAENNVEVFDGNLSVDGLLISRELVLWGGVLNGSGTIDLFETNLLFGNGVFVDGTLFNIAGAVNAGEIGGTGSLTLFGDYVQSSAGALWSDIGGASSDMLDVVGNVSLSGFAGVSIVGGYLPRWRDQHTILTYSGDLVGEFDAVADLPGVLHFAPVYRNGAVDLRIEAASFFTEANFTSPAQEGFAQFFDDRRSSAYDDLNAIYTPLDLLSGEALIGAIDTLVPHEAIQFRRATLGHQHALDSSMRNVMLSAAPASGGGQSAEAMFSLIGSQTGRQMSGTELKMAAQNSGGDPVRRTIGEGLELFFAAGAIEGNVETTSSSLPEADLEGAFAQAGISAELRPALQVGAALGFAQSDTEQSLGLAMTTARGDNETTSFTGFAAWRPGAWIGYGGLTYADHSTSTRRTALVGPNAFDVQGEQDATTLQLDAMIAHAFTAQNWSFTPVGSLTWRETEFDAASQAGSIAALTINEDTQNQLVTRVGGQFAAERDFGQVTLVPRLYAGLARDWIDYNDRIFVEFGATPGLIGIDNGLDVDSSWAEYSAEIAAEFANGFALSLGYDNRQDAYGASQESFILGARLRY